MLHLTLCPLTWQHSPRQEAGITGQDCCRGRAPLLPPQPGLWLTLATAQGCHEPLVACTCREKLLVQSPPCPLFTCSDTQSSKKHVCLSFYNTHHPPPPNCCFRTGAGQSPAGSRPPHQAQHWDWVLPSSAKKLVSAGRCRHGCPSCLERAQEEFIIRGQPQGHGW